MATKQIGGWYNRTDGSNQRYWGTTQGSDGKTYELWTTNPDLTRDQVIQKAVGQISGNTQQSSPQQDPVQAAIDASRKAAEEILKQYETAANKSKEFDQKNPFNFDEAQARASSKERFDPFYDAELGDYITGVENARSRSNEDASRVQRELTADTNSYVGQVRRQVDDAIDSAKEGFAGTGLFASGKRIRREGQIQEAGQQDIQGAETQMGRGLESTQRNLSRTLEDLGLGQKTFERKLGAERETSILGDVESQKNDALKQREFERQQYVGYPLSGGTSSLSRIYGV